MQTCFDVHRDCFGNGSNKPNWKASLEILWIIRENKAQQKSRHAALKSAEQRYDNMDKKIKG